LLSEIDLGAIHQHLTEILEAGGVHLAGIYYCPHHPKAGSEFYRRRCECRKPEPGFSHMLPRNSGWICREAS
jgi:D-glycero-D-manno-heptose 1,7-bisphosphate phosphatase